MISTRSMARQSLGLRGCSGSSYSGIRLRGRAFVGSAGTQVRRVSGTAPRCGKRRSGPSAFEPRRPQRVAPRKITMRKERVRREAARGQADAGRAAAEKRRKERVAPGSSLSLEALDSPDVSIDDIISDVLSQPLGRQDVGGWTQLRSVDVDQLWADVREKVSGGSAGLEAWGGQFGSDEHPYNYLIRCLSAQGRYEEVKTILLPEMEAAGVEPNVRTFSARLSGAALCRDGDAAEEAWQEMRECGDIEPDAYAWASAINAMGRCGRLDQALDAAQAMCLAGHPWDHAVFTTLMAALIRGERIYDAWRMWHESIYWGHEPDVMAYTTMIHACYRSREYEKAQSLFQDMKTQGVVPTLATYNTLIKAAGTAPLYLKGYGSILPDLELEIKGMGLRYDEETYRALIEAYSRGGDADRLRELVQDLKDWAVREGGDMGPLELGTGTYITIMEGYGRCASCGTKQGRRPRWGMLPWHQEEMHNHSHRLIRARPESAKAMETLRLSHLDYNREREMKRMPDPDKPGKGRLKFEGLTDNTGLSKEEILEDVKEQMDLIVGQELALADGNLDEFDRLEGLLTASKQARDALALRKEEKREMLLLGKGQDAQAHNFGADDDGGDDDYDDNEEEEEEDGRDACVDEEMMVKGMKGVEASGEIEEGSRSEVEVSVSSKRKQGGGNADGWGEALGDEQLSQLLGEDVTGLRPEQNEEWALLPSKIGSGALVSESEDVVNSKKAATRYEYGSPDQWGLELNRLQVQHRQIEILALSEDIFQEYLAVKVADGGDALPQARALCAMLSVYSGSLRIARANK
ncbi:unnamed protein product, partial [Chrysoparadoxa australica]